MAKRTKACASGWIDNYDDADLYVGKLLNIQKDQTTYWDIGRDSGDGTSFFIHHMWQADPSLNADVIFIKDEATARMGIFQPSPNAQLHVTAATASNNVFIAQGANSQTGALFACQNSSGGDLFTVDSDGTVRIQSQPLVLSNKISAISNKSMTIMAGTGVPSVTEPSGSLFLRTDGSVGARFYVSQGGGTWVAATGL